MVDAARLIALAISRGAPAFNAGDARECFAIYHETANALLAKPDALPAAGTWRLQAALDKAAALRDNADRAWAMRHGLDDVLSVLRGGGAGGDGSVGGSGSGSAGGDARARAPETSWAVLDFTDSSTQWRSLDDRVMGGASRSRMSFVSEGATFEGELVVDGGGFASVRCSLPRSAVSAIDGARGLLLTCAGDGRSGYKIVLRTDAAADGISYQAGFQPGSAHGQIRLPFEAFQATFRGRPVPGAPALRGADVRQLGFMLSRFQDGGSVDGSVAAGGFKLRLASLAAY